MKIIDHIIYYGGFKESLKRYKVDYTFMGTLYPYELPIDYDLYRYTKKFGQKVIACITDHCIAGYFHEEILLIDDPGGDIDLNEITDLIRNFNDKRKGKIFGKYEVVE